MGESVQLSSLRVRVRLQNPGLEVHCESSGVVWASEVVKSPCLLLGVGLEPGVLLDGQDLALVADCVHRVLVRVRRLEEPALQHKLVEIRAKKALVLGQLYKQVDWSVDKALSTLFNRWTYRQFKVKLSAAGLNLLGVVEPLHLHHHAAVSRLPQHLNLANVGPVAPSSWKEDRAVIDMQAVLAALDGSEE